MEAQMEIQNYLEQGRTALAQGQAREAAIAYAHGAQLEPGNPAVHLGLAEANLALGNYGVVQMASQKVLELQPESGLEAKIAQALQNLLDHRYDLALHNVDAVVSEDPSVAYVHALRSYLLRANGQDYDANLARSRASRLSYGGRFENCFPKLEPAPTVSKEYSGDAGTPLLEESQPVRVESAPRAERESVPNWSRPNNLRRQSIRTRFFLNQNPGFVTNALIALIVIFYLLSSMNLNVYLFGAFDTNRALSGQLWRFVTSLFMYPPVSLLSVLISVLSLFFVGRAVEIFYGPYRYLGIYLLAGVLSNVACVIATLSGIGGLEFGLGPAGSLLGIFGAIGVFYLANRRSLGAFGNSAITSWIFWLILNFALAGSLGAILIEVLAILIGMGVAFLLLPRSNASRGRPLF